MFPEPTDATNAMLKAIRGQVGSLFVPGARYRKSGVVFFGQAYSQGAANLI